MSSETLQNILSITVRYLLKHRDLDINRVTASSTTMTCPPENEGWSRPSEAAMLPDVVGQVEQPHLTQSKLPSQFQKADSLRLPNLSLLGPCRPTMARLMRCATATVILQALHRTAPLLPRHPACATSESSDKRPFQAQDSVVHSSHPLLWTRPWVN